MVTSQNILPLISYFLDKNFTVTAYRTGKLKLLAIKKKNAQNTVNEHVYLNKYTATVCLKSTIVYFLFPYFGTTPLVFDGNRVAIELVARSASVVFFSVVCR